MFVLVVVVVKCSGTCRCSCSCSYLSIYLSICKIENGAILRDFLSFWTWQHQKTQQFCETSLIFEFDNVKNEKHLWDFLIFRSWQHQKRSSSRLPFKNGKLSTELTASQQCVLWFFHSTCLKYCACHKKARLCHTKCCTCHAKSSQQTWRSDAPKCNPSQEISARTSWWTCLLYCACHGKCIFADPLKIFPRLPYKTFTFCSLLTRCTIPCACHAKRHLNVQKCSEPVNFLHFRLRNVLHATTARTFSTSQLPKVVRAWCVLHILT